MPHPIVAVIPVLSSASASKVNLAGGVACAELIKAESANGMLQTNGAALYRTRAANVPADTSFMATHIHGHDFGLIRLESQSVTGIRRSGARARLLSPAFNI